MDISPLFLVQGGHAVHWRAGVTGVAAIAGPLGLDLGTGWVAAGIAAGCAICAGTSDDGFDIRLMASIIQPAKAK
jgi:hypothetical protein